jgi:hypothetical protein
LKFATSKIGIFGLFCYIISSDSCGTLHTGTIVKANLKSAIFEKVDEHTVIQHPLTSGYEGLKNSLKIGILGVNSFIYVKNKNKGIIL